MAKVTVKNISPGPRFFDNGVNQVALDPGQEWEGEIDWNSERGKGIRRSFERRASAGVQEFEVSGMSFKGASPEPAPVPDEFDAMTDQDLREFIRKRDGKFPPASTSHDDLLVKARGGE